MKNIRKTIYFFLTHFFNKFEIKGDDLYVHRVLRFTKKVKLSSLDFVYFYVAWFRIINKDKGRHICFISLVLWDDPESLYDAIKGLEPMNYDELAEMFRARQDFTFLNKDDCFYLVHFGDDGFDVVKYKEEKDPKENLGHFTFGKDFLDSIRVEENSYVKLKKR